MHQRKHKADWVQKMENDAAANQAQGDGRVGLVGDRNDGWESIVSGLGFFALGFLGFLVSFWLAGKVKPIVGIATLFGAGLAGHGTFKLVFGDRWPILGWIISVVAAVIGLLLTCAALFLILGDNFM